jgi:hypothetical protein
MQEAGDFGEQNCRPLINPTILRDTKLYLTNETPFFVDTSVHCEFIYIIQLVVENNRFYFS